MQFLKKAHFIKCQMEISCTSHELIYYSELRTSAASRTRAFQSERLGILTPILDEVTGDSQGAVRELPTVTVNRITSTQTQVSESLGLSSIFYTACFYVCKGTSLTVMATLTLTVAKDGCSGGLLLKGMMSKGTNCIIDILKFFSYFYLTADSKGR